MTPLAPRSYALVGLFQGESMICPNCGQEFEGKRRPNFRTTDRIVAVLIAVSLVLTLACVGACSEWMGANMAPAPRGGLGAIWIVPLLIGAVAISAFIGLAFIAVRMWQG